MKYRKIEKWDAPDNSVSLLYFTQLFDELFFNFTLDTYKPSAMNTSLLCEECLEVIDEIDKGNIKGPNLNHVLKELCENLNNDTVAQSLISINLKEIRSILLDPKVVTEEKKTVVELITRQIYLKKYKKKNEELLVEAITGNGEFRVIRALTRSYATTLLNLGYSSEFISEITKKFFHYDKNRISGNEAINDFIKIFSEKPDIYTLVFLCSKDIEAYKESCSVFNVSILDSLDDLEANTEKFKFHKNKYEAYVSVSEIKARDIFSAKSYGENILEILSTIFGLFRHKDQIKWRSDCLIINNSSNKVERSRLKINVMHKCIDFRQQGSAKKAKAFLSNFGLESNSFNVFTRSAELHSLALSSDSNENQMLNLWIALESIIPPNHDKNISNIEHIVSSVMPFLNVGYYQRLVARFTTDLFNWNRRVTYNLLKEVNGENQVVKVAKLISLAEYSELRNKFYALFNNFHLLKDRFDYLCYIYSDPKHMLSGLESHTKRVGWQIRRIYRARNLIVHSGTTPSYTEMLIENIHDYLDNVMDKTIKLASESKKVNSIEQTFKYVDMKYSVLEKKLKEKNSIFTHEFIEELYGEI